MKPVDILLRHNLRCTPCREGIIVAIQREERALSEQEIKNSLAQEYDRTTFYRSFKTLEEKGVMHKIVLKNQETRYALEHFCDDEICAHTNEGEHVHFVCELCEKVECFEGEASFEPKLPVGYHIGHKEILVEGICANCNGK